MLDTIKGKLKGWKTVICARLVTAAGALVAVHDIALPYASGVDWTPITQRLPGWAVPVGLFTLGVLFEVLRRVTDTPIGQKE